MAEALENAQTQHYFAERLEYQDGGVMQAPVAVDGIADSVILRLHTPREFIVITWRAEKWGEPPQVPHPYQLEPNAVFLDGWRAAELPMVSEDLKGRFWRLRGQYLYAKITPKGLDAEILSGRMPFDPIPVTNTAIPPNYFLPGSAYGDPAIMQSQF